MSRSNFETTLPPPLAKTDTYVPASSIKPVGFIVEESQTLYKFMQIFADLLQVFQSITRPTCWKDFNAYSKHNSVM